MTARELNAVIVGTRPGLIGVRVTEVRAAALSGELTVRPDLLAPNGYLHAATDSLDPAGKKIALLRRTQKILQ